MFMDSKAIQQIHFHTRLRCPDCDLKMSTFRCEKTFVYKCVKCHGVWFDEKKIGIFRRVLESFDLSQFDVFGSPVDQNAIHICRCTRCKQVLDEFRYGYNTDIKLQRCGQCKGIWMPLNQMVLLMNHIKIGHEIAPDLRGWLHELGLAEKELKVLRLLAEIGRSLVTLGWR